MRPVSAVIVSSSVVIRRSAWRETVAVAPSAAPSQAAVAVVRAARCLRLCRVRLRRGLPSERTR
ncbi:hypothetical protein CC117_26350 [Parafrankia colletiae]|uniref:Uncharacterized protein n=1 Tax=Parafrankia colletiae TaxID=573497 RepID=A0A1S1Q964_9ACTN|nr:hypothetical protein CC117_26350 [Parafrankia colletiae]